MKANKHEINGYIYVTSEENYVKNDWTINSIGELNKYKGGVSFTTWKKIILTNNPNLPIQQLTKEEVEYLKEVDSFEVEKEYKHFTSELYSYKIIIPKQEPSTRLKNSLTQFNMSLEEVINLNPIELKKIGFGNRSIIELQYLISENETNFDEWFEKRKIH